MKELIVKHFREGLTLIAFVGLAWFAGSNQSLRETDSRTITELRAAVNTQRESINKLNELGNFAVKRDSLVAVEAKKLGLIK